jgi:predicted nucleic acid-binding protein
MKLVFDTSILIDALRLKKEAREVIVNIEKTDHELFLSSIVGFELYSGDSSRKPDQVKRIKDFLKYFEVVEINLDIAKRAGEIFRDIDKDLGVPDYIVAATALEIGASVVTLNTKHFSKIPGLSIYQF